MKKNFIIGILLIGGMLIGGILVLKQHKEPTKEANTIKVNQTQEKATEIFETYYEKAEKKLQTLTDISLVGIYFLKIFLKIKQKNK